MRTACREALVVRSLPWYVLSRAGERERRKRGKAQRCQNSTEIRPAGPSHLHRAQQRGRGGGVKHAWAGSDPAWAPFQHRKLPTVRLGSDAVRFINIQQQWREQREKRIEQGRGEEIESDGNQKQ